MTQKGSDWSGAIKRAQPDDAAALAEFGRVTFIETFAHLYPAADLHSYLAGAYSEASQAAEIADQNQTVLIAKLDGKISGYAWFGPVTLDVDPDGEAIELKRLYLAKPAQGTGLADGLMQAMFAEARARDAAEIYLSVWVDNLRAKKFYARYGFEEVGRQIFWVGSIPDDDRIWRLRL